MTRITLTLAVVLLASPGAALGAELRVDVLQRLFGSSIPEALEISAIRRPLPGQSSAPRVDRFAYQLRILADLEGRPTDVLGLRLGLDSGLLELSEDGVRIDFRDGFTSWEETFGLGETWAELQLGTRGATLLRAGKLRPRLGGGAVFDAYAFGVLADVDLRLLSDPLPLYARLHVVLPDGTFTERAKTSPLLSLELGVEPMRGLELRLLGLVFVDQESLGASIFADAYGRGVLERTNAFLALRPRLNTQVPRCGDAGALVLSDCLTALYNQGLVGFELETQGLLGWTGFEAEWSWQKRGRLRALALLGVGDVEVKTTPDGGFIDLLQASGVNTRPEATLLFERLSPDGALSVLSFFGLVESELWLTEDLALEGFFLTQTGDAGLSDPTEIYNGFIALAPLLPYTSIFFGGAVLTNLATPVVASASPDGAGLLGGGLGLAFWPTESLRLGAVGALITAPSRSALAPSAFMGGEINVSAHLWLIGGRLALAADGAVFLPGAYFGPETPAAYQAILSASLAFP